jgi:hypothetical protein
MTHWGNARHPSLHRCATSVRLHLAAGGCEMGSEGFHPGSTGVLLVSHFPILPEELGSSCHTCASCTQSRDHQKRDGGNAGDNSMAIVSRLSMSTSTIALAEVPLLVINLSACNVRPADGSCALQVYRGRLRSTGQEVAVKVQRPSIGEYSGLAVVI